MEERLSGTLAIDLGNTNTVVAFQDQKDINSVLVEIPNITSVSYTHLTLPTTEYV